MSIELIALTIAMPLLILSLLIASVRLVIGPRIADRVVALDILGILGIGVIAVYAIATNKPLLIDVALILALIAFLSTVAFAFFLQRRVL